MTIDIAKGRQRKSTKEFRPLFDGGRRLDDELLEARRIASGGDRDWRVFAQRKDS